MYTRTRKLFVSLAVISLVALAFVTSACSSFPFGQGGFSQVVDITLDEELFSNSEPSFKVHDHNFWEDLDVDVDRMELHDGYLRFLGTRTMPDGSKVECSIDVILGAEKGMLTARIMAVDIPGIKLTDAVVVNINQEMEAHLSLEDYDQHAEVRFQEVEITENAMRLKVQVKVGF